MTDKSLNEMSLEELKSYFSTQETDLYTRLKMIRITVENIKDIIEFVNKNKDKINGRIISEIIKNPNMNPADFLLDYVFLEIDSFYEIIKILNNPSFPKIPDYQMLLHDFRDKVAHKDDRQKFKTFQDWLNQRIKLENKRNSYEIIQDFFNYYNKCIEVESKLK